MQQPAPQVMPSQPQQAPFQQTQPLPNAGQAIYYFSLKKLQPQNAGKFNKMGWKVFGIVFAAIFILVVFAVATLGSSELQQTT